MNLPLPSRERTLAGGAPVLHTTASLMPKDDLLQDPNFGQYSTALPSCQRAACVVACPLPSPNGWHCREGGPPLSENVSAKGWPQMNAVMQWKPQHLSSRPRM